MSETVMRIGPIAFPRGSARGIKQTLELIGSGELRRTVNGDLVDLTRPQLRKYKCSISCSDQGAPTLDGIWRGQTLLFESMKPLRQQTTSAAVTLGRDPVDGSVVAMDSSGTHIPIASISGRSIVLSTLGPDGRAVVEYRPALSAMVTELKADLSEWDAAVSWSIDLEEV